MRLSCFPLLQCLPMFTSSSRVTSDERHDIADAMSAYVDRANAPPQHAGEQATLRLLAATAWASARIGAGGRTATAPLTDTITRLLSRGMPEDRAHRVLAERIVDACSRGHAGTHDGHIPRCVKKLVAPLLDHVCRDSQVAISAGEFLRTIARDPGLSPDAPLNNAQQLYACAVGAWVALAPPADRMARDHAALQCLHALQTGRIDVSDLALGTLPELPAGLRELVASDCQLRELPLLPASLEVLQVDGNHLTHLPPLPTHLRLLNASDNTLTSLAELPPTLRYANLSSNQLTALPDLPPELRQLDAQHNRLRDLPALPTTLESLAVSGNPVEALPDVPDTLQELFATGTSLRQLPNGVLDVRRDARIEVPVFQFDHRHFDTLVRALSSPSYRGPELPPMQRGMPGGLIEDPTFDNTRWLAGPPDLFSRPAWGIHGDAPGAAEFERLLERLADPVDKHLLFGPAVRMWLGKLEATPTLARKSLHIAREFAQRAPDASPTSIFYRMKAESLAHDVQRGAYDGDLPTLLQLGRGAYRIERLAQIALDTAKQASTDAGHDVARGVDGSALLDADDIRLAFEVQLRERLALPVDVDRVRHEHPAVTPAAVRAAEQAVLTSEAADLPHFLLTFWAPWKAAMARLDPDASARLQAQLDARLAAFDSTPGDADASPLRRDDALRKSAERQVHGDFMRTLLETHNHPELHRRVFGKDALPPNEAWQLAMADQAVASRPMRS